MKYGRKQRDHDPRFPHYSSLRAGQKLPAPPSSFTSLANVPNNVGMMLNDSLGDCTCAGYYHARQVWSAASGKGLVTEPDTDVEALYEAMGYVPNNPNTDNGANEQDVIRYLLNTGAPVGVDGGRHKLTAAYEIDPANMEDVKWSIAQCGLVYIGFNVPVYLQQFEGIGSVWDVQPSMDNSIEGGHCVIVPGYLDNGNLQIVSWGSTQYQMTPAFWHEYVDECYGFVDNEYITATGKTPAGLTISQWEEFMKPLQGGNINVFNLPSRKELAWNFSLGLNNILGGKPEVDLNIGITL